MRKALVVGVNYYAHATDLHGCVNDAFAMKGPLERNSDGSVNFAVRLLTCTGPQQVVDRATLREHVRKLFEGDSEVALFYFAGHGCIDSVGGYLVASDSKTGDDGLSLTEIMTFANNSSARNRIVVLDSCHAGFAGTSAINPIAAEIVEGTTILAASTASQYASEENGSGVFTRLFVDAMSGAAANLVGEVTPGSVYAHVDQSLGPWDQRPVFKTNVKSFVSLRKVQAPVELADLRRLIEFFPTPGFEFSLDPSFEPERADGSTEVPPDPDNTRIFGILQKFNRVNLVVPVGAPHMWHAAMQSKACKLTVLGEHYRCLVENGRI